MYKWRLVKKAKWLESPHFCQMFFGHYIFAFCMFSPAYIGNLSRGRRVYCSPSRRMIASERIHGTNGRMEMRKNMWNRKSPSNLYFFPCFLGKSCCHKQRSTLWLGTCPNPPPAHKLSHKLKEKSNLINMLMILFFSLWQVLTHNVCFELLMIILFLFIIICVYDDDL